MKLLFLHGAPAVGKLTIAKEVLRLVPGRLFDNHAAIDFARNLFDFGAPGFWDLVHTARAAALEEGVRQNLPLVVMTFCYAEPDDRLEFEAFEKIARRHGGELVPVFLNCPRDEAMRRVSNSDRIANGKMASPQALMNYLDLHDFRAVPRPDVLVLDTGAQSADVCAAEIVRRLTPLARDTFSLDREKG